MKSNKALTPKAMDTCKADLSEEKARIREEKQIEWE